VPVACHIPACAERRTLWRAALRRARMRVPAEQVDALASRFRLTPGQIGSVVAAAVGRAAWRVASSPGSPPAAARVGAADLFACARAQSGHDLAALATRLEAAHGWEDIVLAPDAVAQLRELCQRVALRERVLGDWGFGARLSRGKGTNALFTGPPGTGKTMAAEIVARELGLDLYRVDLAGVVSKYIGETEKNLDRIFTAAQHSDAIIFFDEADALFGKRSEVHDSHDRYANIEISYLLQKMEQYEGITILATNLRGNLDEAFARRLAFTVHFPFPDEASRRRIWAVVWPREVPLAENVDFDRLARQFKLSGGSIRNIAVAAAFLAAEGGGRVTMEHLLRATQREYQKLGKQLAPEDVAAVPAE
jgi:SpoVK/Ycf46/Vps4 family AAA+-type ATPase